MTTKNDDLYRNVQGQNNGQHSGTIGNLVGRTNIIKIMQCKR